MMHSLRELKARELKCVLDLKAGSVGESLTCRDNLFPSLGGITTKAQSHLCFNLECGTTRSSWPADLSDLDGTHNCKSSEGKVEGSPFNHLYEDIKILKWILKCTGSQNRRNEFSPVFSCKKTRRPG